MQPKRKTRNMSESDEAFDEHGQDRSVETIDDGLIEEATDESEAEPVPDTDSTILLVELGSLRAASESETVEVSTESAGSPLTSLPTERNLPISGDADSHAQRLTQLERSVFDIRATLQNIVPLVQRGTPTGEVLFYLQMLDQRVTTIENYLRMVTSN